MTLTLASIFTAVLKNNDYFGLELSYKDFGKHEGLTNYNYTDHNVTESYNSSVELSGFAYSVVGFIPVSDNFNLFLKTGVIAWDADESFGSVSISYDDSDPLFGFGAEYRLTDMFSLRGAWEMVDIEDADLDMLSINAQINF